MAVTLFRAPGPALPDTCCLGMDDLSQEGLTAQQSAHSPPAFLLPLLPGGAPSCPLETGTDEEAGQAYQGKLGIGPSLGQGGSTHREGCGHHRTTF